MQRLILVLSFILITTEIEKVTGRKRLRSSPSPTRFLLYRARRYFYEGTERQPRTAEHDVRAETAGSQPHANYLFLVTPSF